MKGRYQVFSLNDPDIGQAAGWNCDPLTKKIAPLVFGKTLNYRDEDLVGDIKYLWEPNRHLHLLVLAQAYSITGKKAYINDIRDQLGSWIDQCPYLRGPNWASSLEAAIRLINWSAIWFLTGGMNSPLFAGDDGNKFLERWMVSVYQHSLFIAGNFSRYSSANNHLIGEAAGLFVAAVTWPLWKTSGLWQKVSKRVLVDEIIRQNGADGVNKEQAISYQQFVLDFFLIAALVGRANNIDFPQEYWRRIEVMLEYLASIMDVGGNIPMIGDADDGYVVSLSQEGNFCPYRSLLATGAVLFDRADFKHKAARFDDKTRLLLGREAERRFDGLEADISAISLPIHRTFPEGGYYVLGSDFETDGEVRLIVDAGPLGYQSIAAHGHADALAITLSVAGRELLIDPGTYAYHTKKKWRDYFRGTAAHNTVRVDEEDQSIISGNFMWSTKANAQCEKWESDERRDYFLGCHDGYMRLRDPVSHWREITYIKETDMILIKDQLYCQGQHTIERFLHFSERCQVTVSETGIVAKNGSVTLFVSFPDDGVAITTYNGQENPPRGWVSRRFDVKVPTVTVVARSRISGDSPLTTELSWERS